MEEPISLVWEKDQVKNDLDSAFDNNSETELLQVLKKNSFLFYELYERKFGIQPNFCEVSFGGEYKSDFVWLNDDSAGPVWTLVEIEKPKMKLFTKSQKPSAELNGSIEQIKQWQRYFHNNPGEKRRIFGAVAYFKYILVVGDQESWQDQNATQWRVQFNSTQNIEIRSSDIFYRAVKILDHNPELLWSFNDHPTSLKYSDLKDYCTNYNYLKYFQHLL